MSDFPQSATNRRTAIEVAPIKTECQDAWASCCFCMECDQTHFPPLCKDAKWSILVYLLSHVHDYWPADALCIVMPPDSFNLYLDNNELTRGIWGSVSQAQINFYLSTRDGICSTLRILGKSICLEIWWEGRVPFELEILQEKWPWQFTINFAPNSLTPLAMKYTFRDLLTQPHVRIIITWFWCFVLLLTLYSYFFQLIGI